MAILDQEQRPMVMRLCLTFAPVFDDCSAERRQNVFSEEIVAVPLDTDFIPPEHAGDGCTT